MRRWAHPSRRVAADSELVTSCAWMAPRRGPARPLGRCRVACVVGLLLLAAACGDSSSSMDASPSTTSTPRTTAVRDAATTASKRAIAAYKAMWNAMATASRTADYQSPRLSLHADGDALSQLSRGLYANKQHGIVTKGDPATSPTVTSVTPSTEPTSVAISDCLDGTHWLNYVEATGELQNDTPGARHATTATVELVDGSWKVMELAVGQDGSC